MLIFSRRKNKGGWRDAAGVTLDQADKSIVISLIYPKPRSTSGLADRPLQCSAIWNAVENRDQLGGRSTTEREG